MNKIIALDHNGRRHRAANSYSPHDLGCLGPVLGLFDYILGLVLDLNGSPEPSKTT